MAEAATDGDAGDAGSTAEENGHWSGSISDEVLRTTAENFDDQGAFLAAAGIEAPKGESDWRDGLASDAAKEYAERFTDVSKLVDGAIDMRKQLSTAIVLPGKDATPEELVAYRKQIGVPKTPEGYKFSVLKGEEPTDTDKAFQASLAKTFHAADITSDQAKLLNTSWNELVEATRDSQIVADKQFADAAETALRKAWPGEEYAKNKGHAERASAWAFGDQMEEVRHLETKDGNFIMDHPVMLRAWAAIGREMQEGGLVPPMDADATEQAQDQINELRGRIEKAQSEGNSKEANRLFGLEQSLIAKTQGNKPIVGAGRAA